MEGRKEGKRGQKRTGQKEGGRIGRRRGKGRVFTSQPCLDYDGFLKLFGHQDSAHRGIVQRIHLYKNSVNEMETRYTEERDRAN